MEARGWRSRLKLLGLVFAGLLAFVVGAIVLETEAGIPFDTTFRVACAAACLAIIARIARTYRGARWPWVGFATALVVEVAMFFTPLLHGRASRGEIMMFAAPDAVVMLAARLASFRVADEHQRAVRQQLILGLVVAVILTALLFWAALTSR